MFTDNYVKRHEHTNAYEKSYIDPTSRVNLEGWTDYIIGSSAIYSHRNNYYTHDTFTEGMHSHDYYELIIYLSGDVEYINERQAFKPDGACAVWFKPSEMHTARLLTPCVYERIVIYFSKDFFECESKVTPILNFTNSSLSFASKLNDAVKIFDLISQIDNIFIDNKSYKTLAAKSLITALFLTLDEKKAPVKTSDITDDIAKIKNFIDDNYPTIKSIEQIAERFFISREHLSRQFKKRFNINVSDYVTAKRIAESIKLLKYKSVTQTAFSVGFNSMSAFISAFKKQTGFKPIEYKKLNT